MTFAFRPAVRENVGLLIGLAGSSGSGKTFTAMRLASGIAGDKPFAVIDTEAGRAKHYADRFRFDHGDLKPPFSPTAYSEAIAAADAAGYPVIVVDSMTHEWAGDGGVLDMQDAEHAKSGYKEGARMASWIRPKMAHKAMVAKLLQVRAHLILCFRAEEKIEIVKVDGKTQVVPKEGPGGFKGWLPICEKNLPYELTASFLLTADAPGMPKPIKLQDQHRPLFPLDRPIDEESGRAIAAWAAGGAQPATKSPLDQLREEAKKGTAALRAAWERLPATAKRECQMQMATLKAEAAKHDEPDGFTLDEVVANLEHAKSVDELDEAASVIDTLPDLLQREKARDRYHELRAAQ